MSILVLYLWVLIQDTCFHINGQPTTGSLTRFRLVGRGFNRSSKIDGNSTQHISTVEHLSYNLTINHESNEGNERQKTQLSEMGIHDNSTMFGHELHINATEISTSTKQNGNSDKLSNHVHHFQTTWAENVSEDLPQCKPESCNTTGISIPSCLTGSCEDVSNSCNCDVFCAIFGDCCSDVISALTEHTVNVMIYRRFNWQSWFLFNNDANLISLYVNWSECTSIRNGTKDISIRMISKCPRDGNYYRLYALCENSSNLRFVSLYENVGIVGSKMQIVFKNKFCACCHGFAGKQVIPWKTDFHDPSSKLYFPPQKATGQLRKCRNFEPDIKNDLTECKQGNYIFDMRTLCGLNIFPINTKLIDSVTSISLLSDVTHSMRECETTYFEVDHNQYLASSAIHLDHLPGVVHPLFSFYGLPHVHVLVKKPSVTLPEFPHQTTEYPFIPCPVGFFKAGHQCQKDTLSQKYESVFNITMKVRSCSFLNITLYDLSESGILNFGVLQNRTDKNRNDNIFKIDLNSQNMFLPLISAIEESCLNTDPEFLITSLNSVTQVMSCLGNETRAVLHNVILTTINSTLFITNSQATYLIPFPFDKFSLTNHIDTSNISQRTLSYCSIEPSMHLNCSSVDAFPLDQFIFQNNTVRLRNAAKSGQVKFSHHTIMDNTLLVCVERELVTSNYSHMRRIATYVSNICISFSIISLILLVYYHFTIPRLLNLHGKIVVSFSISLAISQLLSLLNSSFSDADGYLKKILILRYICSILGRVYHFSWLCTFAWSAIMAYDICRKFSVCTSLQQQIDSDQGRYRFRVYLSVAILLPFSIVLVSNIVAVFSNSNQFYLGYGDDFYCSIRTFEGKLYAFDAPLFVIYGFSIVCLVISLHGLEYSRWKGKHLQVTRKRDKSRCMAYTRITLMIGITWLFAVVAIFTNSFWIGLLSVFINGLQGLLMFVGLLLNVQTRKVMLARFRCRIHKERYSVYMTKSMSR